ncbi:MAG TPA: hypothetical protein DCQ34_07305 [Chitinophagaceae bacterium]|nr:hypothetical protein [Chitinophagaceae bacterium]HCY90251.1 hypothetical protein [Chitinophagaceae bacterium]
MAFGVFEQEVDVWTLYESKIGGFIYSPIIFQKKIREIHLAVILVAGLCNSYVYFFTVCRICTFAA